MHLVLHGLEEEFRRLGPGVVVLAEGVDVENLPPEDALGGANIPDAIEQFAKVVAAAGFLEAFVVERETLEDVFAEPLRGAERD